MHLFYNPRLEQDIIELSAEESRHCAKVLRLKAGAEVGFTDGRGLLCKAKLVNISPGLTTASVFHREVFPQRAFRLHMAVAPTKSMDRFEWFLEKATECGVDVITPIICAQSERTVVKRERLEKILVAAMKQSQRVYLPVLNDAVRYKDFMKGLDAKTPVMIAHCHEGQKKTLGAVYKPGSDATILIGSEGDFSAEEIKLALEKGAVPVSLGEARLRTETAAIVACIEVNFLNAQF